MPAQSDNGKHSKAGDSVDMENYENEDSTQKIEQFIHDPIPDPPLEHSAYHPEYHMKLGQLFKVKYAISNNIQYLGSALEHKQAAVDLTPEGHPDRAQRLKSLAISYTDRYQRLGDLKDLEAALQYDQAAVDLTPEGHPDKAQRLQNLAISYTDRYQRLGDLKDLQAALDYKQAAIDLTPDGHPDKAQHLQNLAISYTDRYQRLGDLKDLETALQYHQVAVDLTPEGHPDEAQHLHGLAGSYTERFQRLNDLKDLETALQYNQTAVDLISDSHPNKAQYLRGLAASYTNRYKRLGDLKDIEAALHYRQAAIDLTPKDHPDKARQLRSLAISYTDQYRRLGDVKDLEAALQYSQAAVDLVPEGHPDKALYLQSLAISYADQYRRLGDLKDLEAALHFKQAAISLTPDSHPSKAQHLQSLAISYTNRYRRLGDLIDLETALQYYQAAVNLTPRGHPNKAHRLLSLASSYTDRYQRLDDLKDLEAALKYKQAAIDLTPQGHPEKAQQLRSLAISYTNRYQRLGNIEDLGVALQYNQAAVGLIPEGHPEKAQHLQSLASSYTDRYRRLGDMKDFEAALKYSQTAVDLIPEGHPNKARHLQGLAQLYRVRYKRLTMPDDLKLMFTHFEASMKLMTSTPESSWKSALSWASFAAEYQPKYCIATFKSAFHLLSEILWIGHSIPVRHAAVQRLDIPQATSTATRTCINLLDLTSAVEIMEQGLGTIYQQMLQLKTAVDELPPEQAQHFQQLSRELYTQGSDPSMNIVNQRSDLIKDIRKRPGFEYFLLPKPYKILCQASQGGPIVILNSHKKGCDGLIILNPTLEPVHVAFQNVTLDLLDSQRTTLDKTHGHRVRGESTSSRLFGHPDGCLSTAEQFEDMLSWLWTCIVHPVYQVLELHGISNGRLWWLPTGAFTGLPLHACPPEDRSDQFIHSYTATLGSLLEANAKKSASIPCKLVVVGVTQTNPEGTNYLKGVGQELESILSVVEEPAVKCLKGEQATVDAVKMQLQDCSWLHLACHGKQDLTEPTKSHLLLYRGNLELDTILRMPLSNAEVAFLAACQTAMGDSKLINESFHLGGGFIAAGFRGAVGTLWSMADEDGPLVAKLFYSYLFRRGHQPQASDAAEALHLAIMELKKNVSYERWIPFIHMGV